MRQTNLSALNSGRVPSVSRSSRGFAAMSDQDRFSHARHVEGLHTEPSSLDRQGQSNPQFNRYTPAMLELYAFALIAERI